MDAATREHVEVEAFKLGLRMFGCSVGGLFEKVAWRVCEHPGDDTSVWDRTAQDIAGETVNGEPVPAWWALRGFHDARWEHVYGDL